MTTTTQRKPTPTNILDDLLSIKPQTAPPPPTELKIANIRRDGGTQMRAKLTPATTADYAADMAGEWGAFPPVIVYYDGENHWLADGFHRISAYLLCEGASEAHTVPAEIRPGTRRDAVLYAASANSSHGLRRTDADKQRAVDSLLRDDEWAKWSDREIAGRCHVSPTFVGGMRRKLPSLTVHVDSETPDAPPPPAPTERTYTTKHGTQSTMKTDGIGHKPAPTPSRPYPTPREVEALVRRRPKLDAANLRLAADNAGEHFIWGWLQNDCDAEFGQGNWDKPTLIGSMRQVAAELDGLARTSQPAPDNHAYVVAAGLVPPTDPAPAGEPPADWHIYADPRGFRLANFKEKLSTMPYPTHAGAMDAREDGFFSEEWYHKYKSFEQNVSAAPAPAPAPATIDSTARVATDDRAAQLHSLRHIYQAAADALPTVLDLAPGLQAIAGSADGAIRRLVAMLDREIAKEVDA